MGQPRTASLMLLHAIAALGAPTRRPETHEHALQHTQLLAREKSLRLLPTLSAEGKVEMKSVVRGAGEKDCSKCACWLWSDPHIESCYGCEGDYPQRDWDEETQTYKNPATCYDKFGETPISPTKTSECRAIKDAGECSTHPEAGTGCAASCMRCPGDFNPAGRPVHTVAECGAKDVASGDGLYGCGYKIMSYHLPVICEPGDEVDPERADYYPCGSSSAVAFAGRFCGKDHDKHTLVCAGNDVSVDGVSIALGTPGNFTTGKWEYGSCTLERQANKEERDTQKMPGDFYTKFTCARPPAGPPPPPRPPPPAPAAFPRPSGRDRRSPPRAAAAASCSRCGTTRSR